MAAARRLRRRRLLLLASAAATVWRPRRTAAAAAAQGAAAPVAAWERCAGATGLVDPAMWRELRSVQAVDDHGRKYGAAVDIRSDALETFYHILKRQVLLDLPGAVKDCAYGVISMVYLTLPMVDRFEGIDRARELLSIADGLLMEYGEALEMSDWPFDLTAYAQYRLLLGMQQHGCAGSPLRIFVYNSTADLAVRRLGSGSGMMGAACHVHAFLQAGSCVTTDPDEADLFYIPANHGEMYDEFLRRCSNAARITKMLPYLSRRRGVDHFFVVAANLPSWTDLAPLRHVVQLTVESWQVNNDIPRWYSPWKDVMIPGYIDRWRISSMRRVNKPTHERGFIMIFHGHHPGTHGLYVEHKANVRTQILELFSGIPDCSVGGHTPDFFERMGRSHFCLVPRGSSAWTIHLYESFFFGCIPVILSDDFEMPFQDALGLGDEELIDWPALSVKWPMDRIGPELLAYLRAIPLDRVAEMKRRLEAASCFFDYHLGWSPAPLDGHGGWRRWGGDVVAFGSDCPFLGHAEAEDAGDCRAACDADASCNAVNYERAPAGCVLRRCSDPSQPALTSADGWDFWSRAPREDLQCSPYHGMRGPSIAIDAEDASSMARCAA